MGQLIAYTFKRLLMAVPVLLGATIIAFVLGVLAPGDPAREALGMTGIREPSEEELQDMRVKLGLDKPIPVQYGSWLIRAVQGDLGVSYVTKEPVARELARRLPVTLQLAACAVALAVAAGIPAGIWMAARRNTWMDHGGRIAALTIVSIPGFWLAILLILLFSEMWRLLPTSGWGTWKHLVLPSVVLAAGTAAILMRLSRAVMLEVLSQPYLLTARAQGLSEHKLITRHVLKNMLIPLVTVIGTYFGGVLGGAVIVEVIFAIPGLGRYAVDGIYKRDYPVIQGYVVFTSLIYVLFNVAIDLLYTFLNPQVRLGGASR